MKNLFFDGKIIKMGNRLIITVPKALHHLLPKETKVKVIKIK